MIDNQLKQTEEYIRERFENDATGHDWYHMDRVRKLSLLICDHEQQADRKIVELIALLHDLGDSKFYKTAQEGREALMKLLENLKMDADLIKQLTTEIESISFRGGLDSAALSLEVQIVQDADRLDALGAIGIARCFAYGGKKGQALYNPELPIRENMDEAEYRNGLTSSIHHFSEKLLLLKDKMNTQYGKRLAEERHETVASFLNQFLTEWNVR